MLANSHGFVGEYRRSYCSVAAVPIAQDENGGMQRDYWYSVARSLAKLDSAEQVGKEAARRTLRRLGARKVKTAHVPVVLDPMVANSMLEHIFEGVNGDSVYRGASFLAGKLGEKIAGANVTVIDDGTMAGGFGTTPFDGEGIPTRRTVVIENGILKSYLLNTYTAKKLGLETTANASRGLAGTPGIGPGNYFLAAGNENSEADYRGDQRRTLCHRVSRSRRELSDRRLLPRSVRHVDRQWRTGLSGRRDHGGRQSERDVLQYLRDRQRPGISRQRGLADDSHGRTYGRRRVTIAKHLRN